MPMHHKPEWSRELQPDPPNFGKAKRVSLWRLQCEILWRKLRYRHIFGTQAYLKPFCIGKVSLVILSCKRLPQLMRLCESLKPFFEHIENNIPVERILIDNGSGPETIQYAKKAQFFDRIIAHPLNLGMLEALRQGFEVCDGEFILLLEDDFILYENRPFLKNCIEVFREYPEIGIIRLKNQNNWWKPYRRIAPLRRTQNGVEFWTWLPSANGMLNGWASGSVLFRKVSYTSTGVLPTGPNIARDQTGHQGDLFERVYGKRYNKLWLPWHVRYACAGSENALTSAPI